MEDSLIHTLVITRNLNHSHHEDKLHVPSSSSSSLFLLLHKHWGSCHEAMFTFIFIFIISITSILIKYLFMKKKPSTVAALPPGPSPWPVLGCIPEMLRNRPAHQWVHRLMKEMDTDIACFRLGNTHVIPVTSPEIAREVLKKHDAVFASRPNTMATGIVSHGYLTTAFVPWGDQWKKMRRILTSNVFSRSRLTWLLHRRTEEADDLVRFLYNRSSDGGGLINVRTFAQQYCVGVMRRMMFNKRYFGKGRDDGEPGGEEEEHVRALFTILLKIYAFSVSDYLPWLKWLDLDGHRRKVCEAMNVINKYHDPIVNERIRQWREGTKTKPEDLLDVFISLEDSDGNPLLSHNEIRAQIMVSSRYQNICAYIGFLVVTYIYSFSYYLGGKKEEEAKTIINLVIL